MSLAYRQQLADLADTLSAERQLLEQLLFKLVEARLVLAADEARFIGQAMREVEMVLDRIRLGESRRTAAVDRLAQVIGEPAEEITLGFLSSWAPEPYRTMFRQHRDHFHRLTAEIEQASVDNRRLASLAVHNLTDTLGALLGESDFAVYTALGTRQGRAVSVPTRIDEVL